ncbi:hypothetical protein [Candidatus Amarolinea dominans]
MQTQNQQAAFSISHIDRITDYTNSNGDPRRIVRVAPERGGRIANVNEL